MFERRTVKVIIPALNEAESIGHVLAAIPHWVDQVVVVDNGSTDRTASIASQGGATVIREPARGYGRACLAGLDAVRWCDVVVFLDADFSDYPEQMDRLVAPIAREQADMVIGSRTLGGSDADAFTLPQRFGTGLACRLMNLIWRTRHTDLGPFRAVRWSALCGLAMTDPTYGWTIEMQIKAAARGLRVVETPVSYRRRIGRSKISGTVRGVIGAGYKILGTIGRYALAAPPPAAAEDRRLVIFSRYPMPGKAKTRLIPAVGPLPAAALQRRMTEHTIRTARRAAGSDAEIEVRYAGGSERKVRRWLGRGQRFTPQGQGDLGARMMRTFQQAFARGCRRVVLVGTDCPDLSAGDIRDAFGALRQHDLTLGPSADGGYWLIGMARPADVFGGVPWGTSTVLSRTLALAEAGGLSVKLLRTHADVDRPEDLRRLAPGLLVTASKPFLSVVIPALNEADNVGAAIASARCDGVEIIVVDGGSSDRTAALAAQAGARVVACPPGRARQMNRGASAASAEVLLFLHADTILPADYAADVFDALSDPRVVGGAVRFKTPMNSRLMRAFTQVANFRARYLHLPYGDQALFLRRAAFDALGGFEEVPIAEDLHFVRRLGGLGRIVILPAPAVTSARRWGKHGILKTTAINNLIFAGCHLGVRPGVLAKLYRR